MRNLAQLTANVKTILPFSGRLRTLGRRLLLTAAATGALLAVSVPAQADQGFRQFVSGFWPTAKQPAFLPRPTTRSSPACSRTMTPCA